MRIARYVGHEVPTMAASIYSGGANLETMLITAKAIKYPIEIEKIVKEFLK